MKASDAPFDVAVPVTNPKETEPAIYATGAQLHVYGETRAYVLAEERMRPWMKKVASALARENRAFVEDLIQEARVKLWELDPSRLTERDEPWLKRTLRMAMRMAGRVERRQSGGKRAVQAHLRTW